MISYTFSNEIKKEDENAIINSSLYREWLSKVQEKFRVESIHFSSVDFRFHSKEPLFIKLRAEAFLPDGKKVHGIVLVRGNAVGILVVLYCEGVPYLLLVRQPRFPIAELSSLEIPAGILDWSRDYQRVALAELEEEAQIKATPEELIDLTAFYYQNTEEGFAASCGLLDEKIRIFAIERKVSKEELLNLDGKEQSYTEEEEWIRTEVIPYEKASTLFVDGKNLIALFMYERYLESQGRLQRSSFKEP